MYVHKANAIVFREVKQREKREKGKVYSTRNAMFGSWSRERELVPRLNASWRIHTCKTNSITTHMYQGPAPHTKKRIIPRIPRLCHARYDDDSPMLPLQANGLIVLLEPSHLSQPFPPTPGSFPLTRQSRVSVRGG